MIDALFGAGLTRPIGGMAATLIDHINGHSLTVVAIDVPSGLHGDTGAIMGGAPEAKLTVTFFRAKPGHYSVEGRLHCGELKVVDIGIPRTYSDGIAPRLWLNAPPLWRGAAATRDLRDQKYARGHLTLLGGAKSTGAARLAALAARRTGQAGCRSPRRAPPWPSIRRLEPGNLVTAIDDGASFAELLQDRRRNAVLIGPGSGVDDRTRLSTLAALATGRAVVLDADAITGCLPTIPQALFAAISGPVLMTPHEGEFQRLFPISSVAGQGRAGARQAANERRDDSC